MRHRCGLCVTDWIVGFANEESEIGRTRAFRPDYEVLCPAAGLARRLLVRAVVCDRCVWQANKSDSRRHRCKSSFRPRLTAVVAAENTKPRETLRP